MIRSHVARDPCSNGDNHENDMKFPHFSLTFTLDDLLDSHRIRAGNLVGDYIHRPSSTIDHNKGVIDLE